MKLSPPSSISSSSDPPLLSGSSDLQDRLTAVTASISFGLGNDQGFIGLGQDPSLTVSSVDGIGPPAMRVQSTDSLHNDKQILGDPTGKLLDVSESSPRFTSVREGIDAASFVNNIAQGDVGNFKDTSADFTTVTILPHPLADPIVAAASSVSFSDDITGNLGDTAFGRCRVSNFAIGVSQLKSVPFYFRSTWKLKRGVITQLL